MLGDFGECLDLNWIQLSGKPGLVSQVALEFDRIGRVFGDKVADVDGLAKSVVTFEGAGRRPVEVYKHKEGDQENGATIAESQRVL